MQQLKFKVLDKHQQNNYYKLKLQIIQPQTISFMPGQFLMVFVPNHYVGIPLACYSYFSNQMIEIFVKKMGVGTNQIASFNVNDEINGLGPLSMPAKIVENKKILLVAGGIGIASLYELAKQLILKKNEIKIV